MIDYDVIPVGGESPVRDNESDPEACRSQSIESIRARIASAKTNNARIVGGEPVLHPHFDEVVGLLRVRGCQRIRLQTNGWGMLDPQPREQVFKVGVRLFEVRFYSSRAREHDQVAGVPDGFRIAHRAVDYIRRAGESRLGGGPTFLEARIVAVPETVEHLGRILTEASRWRVHQLSVIVGRRPFPLTRAAEAIRLGISRAMASSMWVYLDRWPTCLFPGLELHLRELTRRTPNSPRRVPACEGCAAGDYCPGSPEWMEGATDRFPRKIDPGVAKWTDFYRRVVAPQGVRP